MAWVQTFLLETGQIALEMAPYVVFGLVAAIGVYALFPKDKIERWLGKPGIGSIVKSALAGIPLPLCSCGVVPTALSLKKRGASDGATISFLVSTPETGVDSIAVTYALINPLMTILRPVAAFISAVTTGLAVELSNWKRTRTIDANPETCVVCGEHDCADHHNWRSRLAGSARYVVNDFFPDIANWLVLGIVVSGILGALLPDNLFTATSAFGQMLVVMAIGVPLYICASASTPIAAVLLAKGMTPGAALVFLLVGPATNAASLIVIARLLGRRIATIYVAGVVVTSLLIGILVNTFLGHLDWTPRIAGAHAAEHISMFHWLGLVILALALVNVWRRQIPRWWMRRRAHVAEPARA